MKKIITQLIIVVCLFFAVWFSLRRIDWVTLFRIEQVTQSTEKKLGDLIWDMYSKTEKEINVDRTSLPLDSILTRICDANGIDKSQIKLHLVKSNEVNAFSLPNKHLVINSALISACENEGELCGVMSHEIAHLELNHVMKKLVKEVGLSVLISMTTGSGGAEQIKAIAKLLSSSAYDRNLEKEADMKAVDYLIKAKINPEDFANFMYRISEKEQSGVKYFAWINTHPDSKERAEYIINYSNKHKRNFEPVLSNNTWSDLKDYLTN